MRHAVSLLHLQKFSLIIMVLIELQLSSELCDTNVVDAAEAARAERNFAADIMVCNSSGHPLKRYWTP